MEIITSASIGLKVWESKIKWTLSPYIIYSFFGLVIWGDLVHSKYRDYRLFGVSIYETKGYNNK